MNAIQEITQDLIDRFVGAAHGDPGAIKRLLAKYPRLVNANARWVETPIQAAAQMNRRDIARLLLAAGAPLDICTAAVLGDSARVRAFLQADPSLSAATGAHGLPIMYYPAISGHEDIAEMLLAAGADLNAGAGGNTALHGAVAFGQSRMVKWLLAHDADTSLLDFEGKTALQRAVETGRKEIAALLIKHRGKE